MRPVRVLVPLLLVEIGLVLGDVRPDAPQELGAVDDVLDAGRRPVVVQCQCSVLELYAVVPRRRFPQVGREGHSRTEFGRRDVLRSGRPGPGVDSEPGASRSSHARMELGIRKTAMRACRRRQDGEHESSG